MLQGNITFDLDDSFNLDELIESLVFYKERNDGTSSISALNLYGALIRCVSSREPYLEEENTID